MANELYKDGLKALHDRIVWEERQRIWYQMRHDGLRRKRKPFQSASDLHFPLIDTDIEKIKPFYYNQMFTNDRLAQFVALSKQMDLATASAADYFDYYLKQETNLEDEMMHLIDTMLLTGRGIMKFRWNPFDSKMEFCSVNPIYFIVPKTAINEQDADFCIEVKKLSIGAYKRDSTLDQDPALIQRIRGRRSDTQTNFDNEKEQREGLTYSSENDEIIIWEAYEKLKDDYLVKTFSPQAPEIDLRTPFKVPYRVKREGKPILPFQSFTVEVKDKGWYSPRGIAERQAPFEASLCKMWNEKHDCMTFYNKPMFTRNNDIPNTANIQFRPGEILPQGVQPVEFPQPPVSFDQEMFNTRQIAEQNILLPDFGIGNRDKPNAGNGRERVTAAEVKAVTALAQTGVDLKARIFRKSLGKLYRSCWSILLQFNTHPMAYFTSKDAGTVPQEAMHDNYLIQPDGSPDQWSQQIRAEKAQSRMQMFWGNPFVKQDELTREALQADDPRLVKSLYQPSTQQASNEQEDEAIEFNALLMAGNDAIANPGEDHENRLRTLLGELVKKEQLGVIIPPPAQEAIFRHVAAHLNFLKQSNPQRGKEIEQMIMEFQQSGADMEQPMMEGAVA